MGKVAFASVGWGEDPFYRTGISEPDGTFRLLEPGRALEALEEHRRSGHRILCHDIRGVFGAVGGPFDAIDVGITPWGTIPLVDIVSDRPSCRQLSGFETVFSSHMLSISQTHLDVTGIQMDELIPRWITEGLVRERCRAILESCPDVDSYLRDVADLMYPLHVVEGAGIQTTDGTVYIRFNPMGTKTGRLKVERGFNCLGIPRGDARKKIVSRFDDGKIVSFDFNAIDYRCIVAATEREFWSRYEGAEDFHLRTATLVFGEKGALYRDLIKQLTYVSLYGGSHETVAAKAGIPVDVARRLIARVDDFFAPVRAMRQGFASLSSVRLPNGRTVTFAPDDHSGKRLALYAQSCSSLVFNRALGRVVRFLEGRKSRVIFMVHDEIVVDVCPDELCILDGIKMSMEADPGVPVRCKYTAGKDYDEATQR